MNAHAMTSADVVRLPRRLRVVPSSPALDHLVENGTIDIRQHAAALAYAALRRRYDRSGGPFRSWRDRSGMSDETWQATKRDHAGLIRAAGAERFVLDRVCLDDDAPLSSEVERVRGALDRLAELCPGKFRRLNARSCAKGQRHVGLDLPQPD